MPLAVAAMLTFPSQDARLASRLRTLLDGCIIATALLYASWALVLRHQTAGLFLYWCFAVLVFGRQLLTMLDNQAFHDRLTGLPNRALFHDRVEQALARRLREPTAVASAPVNSPAV